MAYPLDHHSGTIVPPQVTDKHEGYRSGPSQCCVRCVHPFHLSIVIRSPQFSSPLALRSPRHPPSRPQFQQHHVSLHQADERQRGIRAEGLRGASGLQSFIVDGLSESQLHQDLATADRDPPVLSRWSIFYILHGYSTPYLREDL